MTGRKIIVIRDLPAFFPALEFIRREEGLRLVVYLCPAGVKTVGWGHVVEPHDGLKLGDTIREEQAAQFLEIDVTKAFQSLFRLVHVPLSDSQQIALVSFIFNLGAGRFQASSLRQKINREEFDAAEEEFGRWVYARDPFRGLLKLNGLAARRRRESLLFSGQKMYASPNPHPRPRATPSPKYHKSHPAPFHPSLWQKVALACMGVFRAGQYR